MNIQSLTLLTTLITIISNLLSLNETLSKNGVISIIKILSYYILPLLFIQQILLFTYSIKFVLSIIFCILPLVLLIELVYRINKRNFFNANEVAIIICLITSSGCFLGQSLILECFIPNYNIQLNNYINCLREYKISEEMYIFLVNNLLFTFSLIINVVAIILFFVVEIKATIYFGNYHNITLGNNNDVPDDDTLLLNSMVLCCVACGLSHFIINWIISLF